MSARLPDYTKAGDGDVTVYLLHGGYGCKEYFQPLMRRLTGAGYRVIAWDAPGYGISPLPDAFSIEALAEACARLIEATHGHSNIVLGHSMGGLIAPLVAGLCPAQVDAIVLSATVSSFGHLDEATQREFVAERVAPLDAGKTMRDVAAPLVRSMMNDAVEGPDVDRIMQAAAETPDATFRAAIGAIVAYDGAPALAALQCPALVIAGEIDPIGRADALQTMADGLARAEYHCLKNCGHYAWIEDSGAFDEALMPFLAQIAQTRTS